MTNAKRITRTYTQTLKGSPSEVFPLLCPVREYDWIQIWECEMIYSDSGVAEKNCIFKTNYHEDISERTWVVTIYEPNERIAFIVSSADNIIDFTITLINGKDGTTVAEWKQVVTALTPAGEEYINTLTPEKYEKEKIMLENMLNHYLTTGEMLKIK